MIKCSLTIHSRCCTLSVTVNSQVHESTKHTQSELMFGQPPRSVVLPDVSYRGKIGEEDLKDDTCAKEEDSRGIVKLLWI